MNYRELAANDDSPEVPYESDHPEISHKPAGQPASKRITNDFSLRNCAENVENLYAFVQYNSIEPWLLLDKKYILLKDLLKNFRESFNYQTFFLRKRSHPAFIQEVVVDALNLALQVHGFGESFLDPEEEHPLHRFVILVLELMSLASIEIAIQYSHNFNEWNCPLLISWRILKEKNG
jgi:hypothetical protein